MKELSLIDPAWIVRVFLVEDPLRWILAATMLIPGVAILYERRKDGVRILSFIGAVLLMLSAAYLCTSESARLFFGFLVWVLSLFWILRTERVDTDLYRLQLIRGSLALAFALIGVIVKGLGESTFPSGVVFGRSLILISVLVSILPSLSPMKSKPAIRDIFCDFVITEGGLTFCLLLIFSSFSNQLDYLPIWTLAEVFILVRLAFFFFQLNGSPLSSDLFRTWTQLGVALPLIALRSNEPWAGELAILVWFVGMQAIRMVAQMPLSNSVKTILVFLFAYVVFFPVVSFDFLLALTYQKLGLHEPESYLMTANHLIWVITGVLAVLSHVFSSKKSLSPEQGIGTGVRLFAVVTVALFFSPGVLLGKWVIPHQTIHLWDSLWATWASAAESAIESGRIEGYWACIVFFTGLAIGLLLGLSKYFRNENRRESDKDFFVKTLSGSRDFSVAVGSHARRMIARLSKLDQKNAELFWETSLNRLGKSMKRGFFRKFDLALSREDAPGMRLAIRACDAPLRQLMRVYYQNLDWTLAFAVGISFVLIGLFFL